MPELRAGLSESSDSGWLPVTYAEEQHWKQRGPDAIDAEMERRIAVWLEQRCGDRFRVRGLTQDGHEPNVLTVVWFQGTRAQCLEQAQEHPLCWIEHEDRPAFTRAIKRIPMTADLRKRLPRRTEKYYPPKRRVPYGGHASFPDAFAARSAI